MTAFLHFLVHFFSTGLPSPVWRRAGHSLFLMLGSQLRRWRESLGELALCRAKQEG